MLYPECKFLLHLASAFPNLSHTPDILNILLNMAAPVLLVYWMDGLSAFLNQDRFVQYRRHLNFSPDGLPPDVHLPQASVANLCG